ncbi:DUF2939 domain-containing protein [Noviherbaspirillum aridicola]|uniref:DUF2939 family protein n=1 Tax=Noviherbaspirillum aridicola TaxID=2849687 RepID=A0ABQ4PYY1_9BURK|nr:DUF2939 domain-containing protein [Noviherbaspirillum aridicola]GIZ50088.1 hypothetical protein NCCP691_01020 [Noviherbaspirillum aridicola]
MLRKNLSLVAVLALLVCAANFFSPYWTVQRMRGAIAARDYETFSAYVDYPALRESFKQQLAQGGAGADEAGGQDPFAAIGQGLARAVTGPLIDLLLGPAALIEMLNAGRPGVTRSVMSAAVSKVPASAEPPAEMSVGYRDWHTVIYRREGATDAEGYFILRREGWWRWRLAAVMLPS